MKPFINHATNEKNMIRFYIFHVDKNKKIF